MEIEDIIKKGIIHFTQRMKVTNDFVEFIFILEKSIFTKIFNKPKEFLLVFKNCRKDSEFLVSVCYSIGFNCWTDIKGTIRPPVQHICTA
jgi:hypothetical protein